MAWCRAVTWARLVVRLVGSARGFTRRAGLPVLRQTNVSPGKKQQNCGRLGTACGVRPPPQMIAESPRETERPAFPLLF